jgi:hypothetical protein
MPNTHAINFGRGSHYYLFWSELSPLVLQSVTNECLAKLLHLNLRLFRLQLYQFHLSRNDGVALTRFRSQELRTIQ